ncbi:hypothetical protein [Arthrobacter sp. UYEF20]|uniref:hypothetical protein n=1 Tax=Arthrobacter sp. UYEF20 TaxID=1756363 RepID=UPI00339A584D
MASKKSGRKAGRNSATGSRGVPAAASLAKARAANAVDVLTPDFVRWFDDGSPGAGTSALECLEVIRDVAGRYCEVTGSQAVTAFEADALDDVLEELIPEEMDEQDAVFTIDCCYVFIGFLAETGRWTGSAEELADVNALFSMGDRDPTSEALPVIHVPALDDAEATAVLNSLPLILHARALLRWLGEGKEVTSTAVLRLKDIEAAAACVGVAARGSAKAKKYNIMLPGLEDPATAVPEVRSMLDVPLLRRVWATLEAAELITISSTRAAVSPDAADILAGTGAAGLEELEYFTSEFLRQAVMGDLLDHPWGAEAAVLQVGVLAAATTADPPAVKLVMTAADRAPAEDKAMAAVVSETVHGRIEELAALGLIQVDTHYRVLPALVRCIAEAFEDSFGIDVHEEPPPALAALR